MGEMYIWKTPEDKQADEEKQKQADEKAKLVPTDRERLEMLEEAILFLSMEE